MTTSGINFGVTADDMNQVITENPVVGLQLRIVALSRKVTEQQVHIEEQQALIEELQSQTKTKKGRLTWLDLPLINLPAQRKKS